MPTTQSTTSEWFQAVEAVGDFMGIRYGRLPEGATEPEWSFVSHCECDGVGGFARLLRKHGASLDRLPKTKHSCRGFIGPLWRKFRDDRSEKECANRADWQLSDPSKTGPPKAVAWHLFTEIETQALRERCRSEGVTVNSFLLKYLDQAVRPDIKRSNAAISWMIPVNLRGDINHDDDTSNHVSYVEPQIAESDSVKDIQLNIRRLLERGEHRFHYIFLVLGKFLSHDSKVRLIKKDRIKTTANIGAFSNLGVWDSEKFITTQDSWLFCPPVSGAALLGAGCVTFQGRLCLTIQAHPGLSQTPEIVQNWMRRWFSFIEL